MPTCQYIYSMSRTHLWLIIGGIMFMMVWGLDIIALVKYNRAISTDFIFNPFHISQLIYGTITLLFTKWLLTKLVQPGKYTWLLPGLVVLVFSFVILRYLIEQILYPHLIGYSNYPGRTSMTYYFLDNVYYAIIYIGLGAAIYFADELARSRKRQAALQDKSREAELAFLRSQINPHFLFNSLNNIYSLSYKGSEKTSGAILKLSELMRYMLYEKKETVNLETEWEYVRHFIALQQLRYDHPLQTILLMEGDTASWEIPPYLLITLAENAFKHGDFSGERAFVLNVNAGQDVLNCYSQNFIAHQQKDPTGGIGLDNICRRLELMYEGRHQLSIQKDEGIFRVSFQITR